MFLKRLLLLLVIAMACGIVAQAQVPGNDSSVTGLNIFWIKASDDALPGDQATLYFCNWVNGTFGGPDSAAPNVKEFEGPPPSPGFDVRWTAPARASAYGIAHYLWDIREVQPISNPTQVDTFSIKFSNNDNPGANFTFKWDHSWLASRADSCFIRYFDAFNSVQVKVDMFNPADSVYISSDVIGAGLTKFTIYKYGDHPLKVKEIKSPNKPSSFALHQNYPNPFNPTTTIRFDVQKSSFVEIAVFNLLGQRVATLASEQKNPGSFSVTWNGLDAQNRPATSGVYFARMIARGNDGIEQFSALRKLLLMK